MILAQDRSMRSIDADGRLHIEQSHISKASICPYQGSEIPGCDALGLDPDKIYKLYRDPVELEKAASTFARLPILKEHVPVSADSPKPELVIGAIGSRVSFVAPYLDADLCFWDSHAIGGIESGSVKELSCSYRYVPDMTPGDGYDGVMRDIVGNHLALVEVGRVGPDVVAADSHIFIKEPVMKQTKTGAALLKALTLASPVLAVDASLPKLAGAVRKRGFKKDELLTSLLAIDASLDSNKLDAVLEAIVDLDDDPKAQEPTPAAVDSVEEQVSNILKGKVDNDILAKILAMLSAPAGTDEDPKEDADEKMKKAMDGLRKDMRDANQARADVRIVVGDVLTMDSAEDIYGFALDQMKVDHAGVEGVAALRALYRVASTMASKAVTPVYVAQDESDLVGLFPGLDRIRQA